MKKILRLLCAVLVLFLNQNANGADIKIAVASNFSLVMQKLAAQFEAHTQHTLTLMVASTAKHYAQIKNGAPVDIFFSADIERPTLLEQEKIAVVNSRFTYAIGKLVLWSPQKIIDGNGDVLKRNNFRYLAIANPQLAPYGQAAQQTLTALGLWASLQTRIVRGEDIGQTFQFVTSGNAQLGFVAYSQIKSLPDSKLSQGSFWYVPQAFYTPLEQQVVLIKDSAAAREFLSFIKSKAARNIMRNFGYEVP